MHVAVLGGRCRPLPSRSMHRRFKIPAAPGSALLARLWGFIKSVLAVDDDPALKMIYKRLAFDACCNEATAAILQVDEAV